MLVKIVIDYKALKANLGLNWETIKNRYEEITTRFRSSYPTKESGASIEEFPKSDDTSIITKERVCTKIKRIKTSFRKDVDSCHEALPNDLELVTNQHTFFRLSASSNLTLNSTSTSIISHIHLTSFHNKKSTHNSNYCIQLLHQYAPFYIISNHVQSTITSMLLHS